MNRGFLLLVIFSLVACSPPEMNLLDDQEIDRAISGTLTAMPPEATATEDKMELTMATGQTQNAIYQATKEARPTNTPRPSKTPTDKPTPSPPMDTEAWRANVINTMIDSFKSLGIVSDVNLARVVDGVLELEIRTEFFSRDSQPDVSYQIIQILADAFGSYEIETAYTFAGKNYFAVQVTTYSADGDYPYESFTELEILQKVANKTISYEEWVTAANAGFR